MPTMQVFHPIFTTNVRGGFVCVIREPFVHEASIIGTMEYIYIGGHKCLYIICFYSLPLYDSLYVFALSLPTCASFSIMLIAYPTSLPGPNIAQPLRKRVPACSQRERTRPPNDNYGAHERHISFGIVALIELLVVMFTPVERAVACAAQVIGIANVSIG